MKSEESIFSRRADCARVSGTEPNCSGGMAWVAWACWTRRLPQTRRKKVSLYELDDAEFVKMEIVGLLAEHHLKDFTPATENECMLKTQINEADEEGNGRLVSK